MFYYPARWQNVGRFIFVYCDADKIGKNFALLEVVCFFFQLLVNSPASVTSDEAIFFFSASNVQMVDSVILRITHHLVVSAVCFVNNNPTGRQLT